tara:strand:+ start:136 stop:291 length:156 start_codon:yes stop_codon:yes gene_type:complete
MVPGLDANADTVPIGHEKMAQGVGGPVWRFLCSKALDFVALRFQRVFVYQH